MTEEKDTYFRIHYYKHNPIYSSQNFIDHEKKYFIEPNELYYETFGSEFVDSIKPYTFGAHGKLCIIELWVDKDEITIKRFTSYATRWHLATNNTLMPLYRGLGKYLLQKVLRQFPKEYKVTVVPEYASSTVLIPYYISIGFQTQSNSRVMISTVEKILDT